jgi:hypothetical protein
VYSFVWIKKILENHLVTCQYAQGLDHALHVLSVIKPKRQAWGEAPHRE